MHLYVKDLIVAEILNTSPGHVMLFFVQLLIKEKQEVGGLNSVDSVDVYDC